MHVLQVRYCYFLPLHQWSAESPRTQYRSGWPVGKAGVCARRPSSGDRPLLLPSALMRRICQCFGFGCGSPMPRAGVALASSLTVSLVRASLPLLLRSQSRRCFCLRPGAPRSSLSDAGWTDPAAAPLQCLPLLLRWARRDLCCCRRPAAWPPPRTPLPTCPGGSAGRCAQHCCYRYP